MIALSGFPVQKHMAIKHFKELSKRMIKGEPNKLKSNHYLNNTSKHTMLLWDKYEHACQIIIKIIEISKLCHE